MNNKILTMLGVLMALAILAGCSDGAVNSGAEEQQPIVNSKYVENDPYMGAPVELVEAPNGAIANKKVIDGADLIAFTKPEIVEPAGLVNCRVAVRYRLPLSRAAPPDPWPLTIAARSGIRS